MIKTLKVTLLYVACFSTAQAQEIVEVGGEGTSCLEDKECFNRIHPAIPMVAKVKPGQTILFRTRDAEDVLGTIDSQTEKPNEMDKDWHFGRVHPITGPVYIEGAKAGDVLAFTVTKIKPGRHGYTSVGSFGFAYDLIGDEPFYKVTWQLNKDFASSKDLPGIKIPNTSFPGVVTTLPDSNTLQKMLNREEVLLKAGGNVYPPIIESASPASVCGANGSASAECLRTIPPREHGGNMDIRYLKAGVTIYLPCYIDGCGLAVGDLHYAQGDGEVGGTAIEMSADLWGTVEILKDSKLDLTHGPHYSGESVLLEIPSKKFYAVTGFPLKEKGTTPRNMEYLGSAKVDELENLSNDINLAARNALDGIVDYIVTTYGYNRYQAYIIASVAVDLRIGQLVDAPNVGVTAILPLDIFEQK